MAQTSFLSKWWRRLWKYFLSSTHPSSKLFTKLSFVLYTKCKFTFCQLRRLFFLSCKWDSLAPWAVDYHLKAFLMSLWDWNLWRTFSHPHRIGTSSTSTEQISVKWSNFVCFFHFFSYFFLFEEFSENPFNEYFPLQNKPQKQPASRYLKPKLQDKKRKIWNNWVGARENIDIGCQISDESSFKKSLK